jgi:adenylosuccinate lyase
MSGLTVYPENMERNMEMSGGLFFSEKVLLALVDKGVTRQEAYKMVQRNAMAASRGEKGFEEGLLDDTDVAALLSEDEIKRCFDVRNMLANADVVFERLERLEVRP